MLSIPSSTKSNLLRDFSMSAFFFFATAIIIAAIATPSSSAIIRSSVVKSGPSLAWISKLSRQEEKLVWEKCFHDEQQSPHYTNNYTLVVKNPPYAERIAEGVKSPRGM